MKERDESTTATIDRRGVNAYRALRDLAGEVLVSDDVENALNRCGALVLELLHADACSVALLDQRAGALVPLLTMAGGRSADDGTGRQQARINQAATRVLHSTSFPADVQARGATRFTRGVEHRSLALLATQLTVHASARGVAVSTTTMYAIGFLSVSAIGEAACSQNHLTRNARLCELSRLRYSACIFGVLPSSNSASNSGV